MKLFNEKRIHVTDPCDKIIYCDIRIDYIVIINVKYRYFGLM